MNACVQKIAISINLILYSQIQPIYQLYEHFHLVSATDAYMSTNA